MYFAISCIDKPDSGGLRLETRPAHIDYLKANAAMVRIAGPYTDDDGGAMRGSLLLVEAADRAAVESFAANDPYAKAGLFASTDIRSWKWTIGNPDA